MTLLTLGPEHRAIVLECGTSVPGEIAELGRIARPSVGRGGQRRRRALRAARLVDGDRRRGGGLLLAARRVAVTYESDDPCSSPAWPGDRRALTFGRGATGPISACSRARSTPARARTLELRARRALHRPARERRRFAVSSRLLGPTAAANVAAALAGALALLGRPATRRRARRARGGGGRGRGGARPPAAGRGRRRPAGARRHLQRQPPFGARRPRRRARGRGAPPGGRLVLVLGDMLELGAARGRGPRRRPRGGGRRRRRAGAGRHRDGGAVARARRRRRHPCLFATPPPPRRGRRPRAAGDLSLVKGSRGLRMERLVEVLQARRSRRRGPILARPTSAASPQHAPSREQVAPVARRPAAAEGVAAGA